MQVQYCRTHNKSIPCKVCRGLALIQRSKVIIESPQVVSNVSEPCKQCTTLREQLEAIRKELTEWKATLEVGSPNDQLVPPPLERESDRSYEMQTPTQSPRVEAVKEDKKPSKKKSRSSTKDTTSTNTKEERLDNLL